jgi:hypothetical protein
MSSANSQLDQFRQQSAGQRAREDKLRGELAVAQSQLQTAIEDLREAHASDDEKLAEKYRTRLGECEDMVAELSYKVSGAELRTQRAEEVIANFRRERAEDLLHERQGSARQTAIDLGPRRGAATPPVPRRAPIDSGTGCHHLSWFADRWASVLLPVGEAAVRAGAGAAAGERSSATAASLVSPRVAAQRGPSGRPLEAPTREAGAQPRGGHLMADMEIAP